MDFDEVADELFGLAPTDFVGVRDARAKEARAAGDRELAAQITALRKPTNVAWLANQLARERPEDVGPFLELGESLREASSSLSGPALRELSKQRQQLVHALVRAARKLATADGPRVTEDVARGLEETLHAALADPSGAELLAAGRLSGGLQHSGFGAPLPGGAAPSRPVARQTGQRSPQDRGGRSRSKDAERRAADRAELDRALASAWAGARQAAETRDAAAAAAADARTAYDASARTVTDLQRQLDDLRRDLTDATQDRDRAREGRTKARDAHRRASADADDARRAVTDLQARLDRL